MDDVVRIKIANWGEHQHYSKRNPPWIKLHSKLLDNAEWGVLPGEAAKLLVELWLLAAKAGKDGTFETTVPKLEWRTRHDSATLARLLNSLQDNHFLIYASAMLAPAAPDASASSIEGRGTENTEELPEIQSSVANATGADAPQSFPQRGAI